LEEADGGLDGHEIPILCETWSFITVILCI